MIVIIIDEKLFCLLNLRLELLQLQRRSWNSYPADRKTCNSANKKK